MERSINAWIAKEQSEGAAIAPGAVSIGGYPFAFAMPLEGPKLKWPSGFGFEGQHVRVSAYPWAPRGFHVRATGGFAFTLPPGTTRPALTIAGETLRGAARFADTPVPLQLTLTADGVSAARQEAEGQGARELTVATLEFAATRPETPPTADTDVGLDLNLHLIDASAQVLEANPLGATIADAVLRAKIMGPLPASPDAAGLKAWRDKGGTIELDGVSVRWGPLGLAANGTIALDSQMQPEAALTAHLTGYEKAIDALAAASWIKPSAASIAKLALGVAAKPGPDGQPSVDTPLTIQGRRISAGPIKLGEMPELKVD